MSASTGSSPDSRPAALTALPNRPRRRRQGSRRSGVTAWVGCGVSRAGVFAWPWGGCDVQWCAGPGSGPGFTVPLDRQVAGLRAGLTTGFTILLTSLPVAAHRRTRHAWLRPCGRPGAGWSGTSSVDPLAARWKVQCRRLLPGAECLVGLPSSRPWASALAHHQRLVASHGALRGEPELFGDLREPPVRLLVFDRDRHCDQRLAGTGAIPAVRLGAMRPERPPSRRAEDFWQE